jgi:hypothetical protein
MSKVFIFVAGGLIPHTVARVYVTPVASRSFGES